MNRFFFLVLLTSLAQAVCPELAGSYRNNNRIIDILQDGCNYGLRVDPGTGSFLSLQLWTADGVAYDRSRANFTEQGVVRNPYLRATDESRGTVIVSAQGDRLFIRELALTGKHRFQNERVYSLQGSTLSELRRTPAQESFKTDYKAIRQ